jgi:DUF1016 N-terminal domain
MDNAYQLLLSDIKTAIREERQKAIRQLNRSLIAVYWEVGRLIVERQAAHGWGRTCGKTSQASPAIPPETYGSCANSLRRISLSQI